MNIDTLMNEMSIQEEAEVVTEEVYVSLYQKQSEPAEEDVCTAMECDEELADELGLDLKEEKVEEVEEENEEEEEETLEEVNARVKEYFDAHLNQPELELESGGKKTYRKYTNEQTDLFIDLISAGFDVKSACSSTDISLRSGYKYRKTFREDPENGLIRRKKRGRKGSLFKLQQRHAEWIIKYIDENTTAVLEQIKLDLCKEFETENLTISRSALHRFMRTVCALSMKRLEKIPARRNHIEVIEQRKTEVEKWIADDNMDFLKNCVFIDEAGFNINITRNRGWSKKGTPAKAIVPSARSTSITILGAISVDGVIDISLRKPTSSVGSKKRKVNGKEVKINGRVGTRSEHFLAYLNNMMDCLDRNGLQGYYLVMDNAPIHKPVPIREAIEGR